MRFTLLIGVVATLCTGACNKKSNETASPTSGGSGSAVQPRDAAVEVVVAKPWKVPAGASAARANADATALGTTLSVHLVEHVLKIETGGGRAAKTVLVIEGANAAIAADETSEGLAQDGAKATMAISGEADIML